MGCCAGLGKGKLVPIKHNVAGAEAYLRTKWHLDRDGHETSMAETETFKFRDETFAGLET